MKQNERSVLLPFSLFLFPLLMVGCLSLPSVGPDYREVGIEPIEFELPDAGQPTSNMTASCEYVPAGTNEDARVVVTPELVARWWTRFNDPVLVSLVEGGISNNVSYRIAQTRLEQAAWELLGSYAAFLPKFNAGASWTRNWYHPKAGSGARTHYNVRSATIDGNWELDIFGGNRRLAESALAAAESAGWSVADAWVALYQALGGGSGE